MKQINLIDRDELIEEMYRSDVSSREKIEKLIRNQPVIAIATQTYNIAMLDR